MLRTREDRSCVFLDERGCSVHPDRPLACRLYPLARWVDPDGNESFGHLEPHPQTAGVYGDKGTVADYLAAQGSRHTSRWAIGTVSSTSAWWSCWSGSRPPRASGAQSGALR